MKYAGIDGNSVIGGSGIVAVIVSSNLSLWLAIATGIATFTYMSLRAAREWIKLKHDINAEKQQYDPDAKKPKQPELIP